MKKKTVVTIIVIVVAIGAAFWALNQRNSTPDRALDVFAQCLAGKGVTMYGADWCSHCQNEKKAFGDSFRFVPYVECPDEPQRCMDAGIKGYPTWVLSGGRRFGGEMGLEQLAKASGCELPQK